MTDPVTLTTAWAVAFVVLLILEGMTVGLTSIWFAVGALAALIVSFFKGPLWLQVALFFAVSLLMLWLTRPLVKKYIHAKRQPTNADRVLGGVGRVTARVDNRAGTGLVFIDGKTWMARSASDQPFEPDAPVRIIRIEGVKLIVEAADAALHTGKEA